MPKLKAYSLIEMMVVIGLICLLMQLLRPSYEGLIKKTRYTEILQALGPMKLSVVMCYMHKGSLRQCQSGISGIEPIVHDHVVKLIGKIEVLPGGVIHAVPKPLHGFLRSDDLMLTPYVYSGGLRWKLSGGAVEKGYVQA
ncbi:MAG TPA: hypothetical protein QF353_05215 [Gammaproteobacteria bacterium]|nr:hypothetical protein [Gammaproteobacteria bacterium]